MQKVKMFMMGLSILLTVFILMPQSVEGMGNEVTVDDDGGMDYETLTKRFGNHSLLGVRH